MVKGLVGCCWSLSRPLHVDWVFLCCSIYDKIIQSIDGHVILVKSMENKNTQGPANNIPIKLLWESVQDTRENLETTDTLKTLTAFRIFSRVWVFFILYTNRQVHEKSTYLSDSLNVLLYSCWEVYPEWYIKHLCECPSSGVT